MVVNIEVRGSRQLRDLGTRLKAAGAEAKMRRDMLAAIRSAAGEAIPDIRESARSTLPRSGGLADRVADQAFAVRTSLVGKTGGRVSIVGRGMKELRDIDRGRLRHPLWGNRRHWYQQKVTPGFFSKPIEKKAPAIRVRIIDAMASVARKLARPL